MHCKASDGKYGVYDLMPNAQDRFGIWENNPKRVSPDYYLTEDGKSGILVRHLQSGAPYCIWYARWQGLNPAKGVGWLAFVTVLAGVGIPSAYAVADNTIRPALIGCGGRGYGAAANAFDSPHGPVKLIAMIATGLQCRHSQNRQELIKRIRDGQLGDIQLIRAYRMQPCGRLGPRPAAVKDLHWQIRKFTHFLWVSGGLFAEMNIHQIDEICRIKDAWPVSAHGVGGRAANSTDCGQNLDSFTIEWTFFDGTKAFDVVRWLPNCHTEFATYIHGTRCAAQFSGSNHEGTVHTYKDQRCSGDNLQRPTV